MYRGDIIGFSINSFSDESFQELTLPQRCELTRYNYGDNNAIIHSWGYEIPPFEAWEFEETMHNIWWLLTVWQRSYISWENGEVWEAVFEPFFSTDGGSVPHKLWGTVSPYDQRFFDFFVWHDLAYQTKDLSQNDADDILRFGGKFRGSNVLSRIIETSVNLFGDVVYKRRHPRDGIRRGYIKKWKRGENSKLVEL